MFSTLCTLTDLKLGENLIFLHGNKLIILHGINKVGFGNLISASKAYIILTHFATPLYFVWLFCVCFLPVRAITCARCASGGVPWPTSTKTMYSRSTAHGRRPANPPVCPNIFLDLFLFRSRILVIQTRIQTEIWIWFCIQIFLLLDLDACIFFEKLQTTGIWKTEQSFYLIKLSKNTLDIWIHDYLWIRKMTLRIRLYHQPWYLS